MTAAWNVIAMQVRFESYALTAHPRSKGKFASPARKEVKMRNLTWLSNALGCLAVVGVLSVALMQTPAHATLVTTGAANDAGQLSDLDDPVNDPSGTVLSEDSAKQRSTLMDTRAVLPSTGHPPRHDAALLSTRMIMTSAEWAMSPREHLLATLERDDVVIQLEEYGIPLEEAQARVESLTDDEILQIAGDLGALPAGGHAPPDTDLQFVGHPLNPVAWLVNTSKVLFAILGWIFHIDSGEQDYDPS
jgi:hypothetical protein